MRLIEILEAAGVGTITPQNSTADVNSNSIKKNAKKFGFNVTKGGIPPLVSKDSYKK